MRKVIDGKTYDTKTAKYLGSHESNYYQNDFNWYYEELYCTKKGTFFLSGEGNGLSRWAHHFSDGYGPGDGIRVLSIEDAKEWVERHLNIDTYIALFGKVEG